MILTKNNVLRLLSIDVRTPGRVEYDPLQDDVRDMRSRLIPPKKDSNEAKYLGEEGI